MPEQAVTPWRAMTSPGFLRDVFTGRGFRDPKGTYNSLQQEMKARPASLGNWSVSDKVSLGDKAMPVGMYDAVAGGQTRRPSPFAATQARFAVPNVTGQYEQQPQGSGGGGSPYGMFQQRQAPRAPWMNDANPITMGQYNQPQFASTAPPQTPFAQVDAARLARQDASGGRLNYTRRGNVGNYTMTPGEDGIDAQALVRQNPLSIYGFSPQHQQQLAMDPNYQADLKGRQAAYQQRQMAAAMGLAQRQGLVQERGMGRGQARQDRLLARKQGPSQFDFLMQRNPQLALQMMQMQNQNAMLAQNLGLQNRKLDQGDAALGQGADKLKMEGQQFDKRLLAQTFGALVQGGLDPEEAMAQAMGLAGGGQQGPQGLAAAFPGMRGGRAPSKKDEAALMALTDPTERRNYMRDILKLSPQEITARLRQDYKGPGLGQHLMGILGGGMRGAPNSTSPEGAMVPAYGGGLMNLFGLGNSEYQDEGPGGPTTATNFLAPVEDFFTGKKRKWQPAGFPGVPR